MLTNQQARLALKGLIEKYLKGVDPNYNLLVEIMEDTSQQLPVRGVLEDIRLLNNVEYTLHELDLIDDLLYMYG